MKIESTSTIYVPVPIYSWPQGLTIENDPVYMAFQPLGADTIGAEWLTASWLGGANIPTVICLVGPNGGQVQLQPGSYQMYVRIVDNPEIPDLKVPGALIVE